MLSNFVTFTNADDFWRIATVYMAVVFFFSAIMAMGIAGGPPTVKAWAGRTAVIFTVMLVVPVVAVFAALS